MLSDRAVAIPATQAYAAPPQPMVADQLDALLGEHLMPLRARTPGKDEPYLLAVDASGQPVVVEVMAVLDEDSVLQALRHAGRAARMSTRDLAEAYRGGADRFGSHLAAFRLTVPATALLSTFVRGGARLLLVCSHVAPGVADVLEFLLQPGWQVDVLHAQVVTEPDGQRVVELSPVARPTPPRREFDPPPWAREHEDPLFDPTPLFRTTPVRRPSRPRPAEDAAPPARHDPWVPPVAPPVPTVPPVPAAAPVGPQVPQAAAEAVRAQRAAAPVPAGAGASRGPTAATRPAPAIVAPSFAVPMSAVETPPVDPVLAALGEALEGPAPLVWCPDGGGTCYEAMLGPDGVVHFADGSRFGDLDAATRAVSGIDGPLDVWQVWHVDSAGGPTLAELAAAVFPEQF